MTVVTARQRKAADRLSEPVPVYFEHGHTDLTKSELKDLASLRGLSTSGTKAELIARLEE